MQFKALHFPQVPCSEWLKFVLSTISLHSLFPKVLYPQVANLCVFPTCAQESILSFVCFLPLNRSLILTPPHHYVHHYKSSKSCMFILSNSSRWCTHSALVLSAHVASISVRRDSCKASCPEKTHEQTRRKK